MKKAWPLVLLLGCALLAYGNTLKNGFVWDDHIYVEGNAFVEEPGNLKVILDPRFYLKDQKVHAGSRPVFLASLMVDRFLWRGRPAGYHLTNLLLHAGCVILVYALALGISREAALLAGLITCLHPAGTEAVNAVSFRPDLLAAVFSLGAVHLLRRRAVLAGVLCWGLGLLSKESAAAAPILFILVEALFPSGAWTRRRIVATAVCLSITALLYAGFRAGRFRYRYTPEPRDSTEERIFKTEPRYVFDPSPPPWKGMAGDAGLRFRTMSGVLADYGGILLWPWTLAVDRAPRMIHGWASGKMLLGWLGGLSLLLCAWLLRARTPLTAFGAAWVLAALLPVSGVVPLHNPVAERYLYLAMPGFAFMLAGACPKIWLVLLLLPYGVRTVLRNADWRSDKTLFFSPARGALQNPRVRYNRGRVLLEEGRLAEAGEEYRAAVAGHPGYAEAWTNLGSVYKDMGLLKEAQGCYERAITLRPDSPMARAIYGRFLEEQGRIQESERMYRSALSAYEGYGPALEGLRRLGKP